jgi:gliding motility-associated-like protein
LDRKQSPMKRLLLFCLCFGFFTLYGQVTVEITIDGATTSTTCDDVFSAPDILYEVDINNQGLVTYPEDGACFTAVPNVQYSENYGCPFEVPAQAEVCFSVFENDPIIPFGCFIDRSCLESICQNFDIPPVGSSVAYTLAIPTGTSTGELNFTISTTGPPDNDLPCGAIDLGILNRGDTLGDMTQGIYNNLCGTDQNEPDPQDEGANFSNTNGVWYTITTGNDIGTILLLQGMGNPENTADNMNLQMAIYQSDNGLCDGNLELLVAFNPNFTNDALFQLSCPQPNTTYYILADGAFSINTPGSEDGPFGMQFINVDVDDAGDFRCDAVDLGAIPLDGQVDTTMANACSTAGGDPFNPDFTTNSSVWFEFQAPPTGHVLIEAITDQLIDSLDLQLALYRPNNGQCNGNFQYIASEYTTDSRDEIMQVSCLFPGDTYFLMVNGSTLDRRGIFNLTISDAGDITPVTQLDSVVICDGDSFSVGSSTYFDPGSYSDTIQLFQGCDSIVNTTLYVLEPISVSVNQIEPAIGADGTDGIATVSATGGTNNNYTYTWCDGQTGTTNSNLVAGSTCCVTVTDDFGCVGDTCITVEFITSIIPVFTADTLDCSGDEDGIITFSVMNGQAPYSYSWQNEDDSINGTGGISAENEEVVLPDLPAGSYTITVMDEYFDTSFIVQILEPSPLVIVSTTQQDASCFEECDGALSVLPIGGVGGYQYTWSNAATTDTISGLCAQAYSVSITDANGCQIDTMLNVTEPEEFIAAILEDTPVACFGDSTGILTVETNGTPSDYLWNTGDVTATVSGLPAGMYSVEVTNIDGCTSSATGTLTGPSAPVSVSIALVESISCVDGADGILMATPAGAGNMFSAQWSNGASGEQIDGLSAGEYMVTISNENNCEASASFLLDEPSRIQASTTTVDITCTSGENGGQVQFDTTFGGTPPYEYSLDGVLYSPSPVLAGLIAGTYELSILDAAGCEESFSASILPPPDFMVDLGPAQEEINLGDSILLAAQSNSLNAIYNWTLPDSLIKNFSGQSIFVSPAVSSTYFVEALDTLTNCVSTDFILVRVNKDRRVYIPNAFSPNDDGRNDVFYIHSDNAVLRIKTLRIFSRTGNMVYEARDVLPNDVNTAWDGTFRGEELDPAVFVYVAEIEFVDGLVEVFKGDVILVK